MTTVSTTTITVKIDKTHECFILHNIYCSGAPEVADSVTEVVNGDIVGVVMLLLTISYVISVPLVVVACDNPIKRERSE